ncbi:PREDICTED: sorting nexin-3 [Corvus brachyrhynchos]|uniref:sorting nexin-3 n=1 Tax=Corvus brachyrhynchos TaxID=85066 RepID=UPI0008165A98|nr:PREDICTED: sorting nexin-3 [Corvus brachyrhynchos]
MAHCNSAVYDVVELDQVMIDAFWQKYRYPYAHFSESNSGLKALDLAKLGSWFCLSKLLICLTSSLCSCFQTNLPIFKLKESTVRRRYSDFEWLRNELERESKVVVPPLPGKALLRQLPFRGDDGIFDDSFIEERKQALEQFINKVAGHPLAQNERCLHMFLQDEVIDKNYTPSKIRHT